MAGVSGRGSAGSGGVCGELLRTRRAESVLLAGCWAGEGDGARRKIWLVFERAVMAHISLLSVRKTPFQKPAPEPRSESLNLEFTYPAQHVRPP